MKRLVMIGAMLAVLTLALPVTVAAESCCDYEVGCCCWEACCAERVVWYEVSFYERVSTGLFFRGVEMTSGVWTHKYVEAHDRNEAAEMLGKEAGYGCFVSRAIGYEG